MGFILKFILRENDITKWYYKAIKKCFLGIVLPIVFSAKILFTHFSIQLSTKSRE